MLDAFEAEKIKKYMHAKRNFLILSGAAGCGKTYIVAAMMEWAISEFNHFRVWKEYDLFKRIREGIDRNWEPTDTLSRLIDDDLIVLDDLGAQGHNDWREKILFEFIDIRYNSAKPTILTTNLDYQGFKTLYGMRITDRLFAKENTYIDLSDAQSFRAQGL